MLKAVHAMESREASEAKALEVAAELESMRLGEAAKVVREGYAEDPDLHALPREHWRRIRTNNAIERLNREIRRRTRVVGTFPDGRSALMLVTARLKYVAESEWGSPPLPGRDAAGRVAAPDGGPRGCRKVRKNLDGTVPDGDNETGANVFSWCSSHRGQCSIEQPFLGREQQFLAWA